MACGCITKDKTIYPDTQCYKCAEKHFSTAVVLMKEAGYESINRNYIIGQLSAAETHIAELDHYLLNLLKRVRHLVHGREENRITGVMLEEIANLLNYHIKNSN